MKLKFIKIYNYKCFYDAPEFDINDVTCLVGLNESGKSVVLEVLYKFNPINPKDSKYETLNSHKQTTSKKLNRVCTTSWVVSEEIKRHCIDNYFFNPFYDEVILYKEFEKNIFSLETMSVKPEDVIISEIKTNAGINVNSQNMKEILQILYNKLNDYNKRSFIEKYFKDDYYEGVERFIQDILPCFIIRNEDVFIKDSFFLDDVENQSTLSEYKFYKDIINVYAEKTPSGLILMQDQQPSEFRISVDLIRKGIENAIKKSFLNDEKNLRISVTSYVYHPGKRLYLEIGITYNDDLMNMLSNQSMGRQWHISFLIWLDIQQKINYNTKSIILLLDEPAMHLHGKAQESILDYIYELIRTDSISQCIYTSHSPFMIKKDRINDVRVVEKNDSTSTVFRNIFKKGSISILPISSSIGFNINSMLLKKNNLIVEGKSDITYINLMNKVLERNNISEDWNIFFTEGITNHLFMYIVLANNDLNPFIVADFDVKKEKDLKEQYEKTGMNSINRITLNDITKSDKQRVDIEDFFGPENYLHLLNSTYGKKVDKLNDIKQKTTYDLDNYFEQKTGIHVHDQHDVAAQHLLNVGFENIGFSEPEKIKERFEELFKKINEKFIE